MKRAQTGVSPPNSPNPAVDASCESLEPSVKSWPGLPDLMKYYPPDAERQGIEGMVNIQVTLDAQGRVTDTLILDEDPLNMRFGAAASALAQIMEYNNPTGQAVQLTFKVKFALGKAASRAASATTNLEEIAYSLRPTRSRWRIGVSRKPQQTTPPGPLLTQPAAADSRPWNLLRHPLRLDQLID